MIHVSQDDAGKRLDLFLASARGVSRDTAAKLIAAGLVKVKGLSRSKSYRLSEGDVIETVELVAPAKPTFSEVPDVGIVFSDDQVIVVDKPSGLVVHPATGHHGPTLVDALLARGFRLAPSAGEDRPGIVHRLDREVSGLLVVAQTDSARETLAAEMAARRIKREYLACVWGLPKVDSGKIEAPIGRHPRQRRKMAVIPSGRESITWFRVRQRFEESSLLEVKLETGRTHQIRVHLAAIGHPILGDGLYGRQFSGLSRPFLHAFKLSFNHPVSTVQMAFSSELPEELKSALGRL